MKRDVRVYIEDILASLIQLEEYRKKVKDYEDFCDNIQIQDAILRRLEVVGEAAKNISKTLRDKYPDIPWKQIAGMRDILIHEYFGVNLRRVFKVVNEDIAGLKNKILKIRKDLD